MLKIHVSKLLTALVNGQLAAALIVAYLTSMLEKVQSLRLAASPALPLLPTPGASPAYDCSHSLHQRQTFHMVVKRHRPNMNDAPDLSDSAF